MENDLSEPVKNFDKKHAYCDALLIQFQKPFYLDMEIPCAYEIYSLVNLSLRKMSNEALPISKVNCLSTIHEGRNEISIKRLEKILEDQNLSEELFNVLKESGDYSELAFYMGYENRFGFEWHFGQGTIYRFRKGEREKAIQRVKEYIPEEHIKKINLIGEAFQEYIGITNSAEKINLGKK